jgi:sec-independent protein translocase protein TatC
MVRPSNNHDPEDMFADTRMSFGDHLEDLRTHLWRAIYGFVIAMLISFAFGREVLYYIIIRPVEVQLQAFYDEHYANRAKEILAEVAANPNVKANKPQIFWIDSLPEELQKKVASGDLKPEEIPDDAWIREPKRIAEPVKFFGATLDAQQLLRPPQTMKAFSVTETFMVWIKVCMMCGLVLGSPWIFYQIWAFVAAGLYPHEKKYVHVYLPFSLGLFLVGVVFCQVLVLPNAIAALLWFNKWLNVEPDLRLNEWLSFAIMLPVLFGVSFQTPLVMLFLERIGVFTVETYRTKRRMAFFILAVFSTIFAPPDALSMIYQVASLCLLYQVGIWLCILMPRPPETDIDVPESEELVEV